MIRINVFEKGKVESISTFEVTHVDEILPKLVEKYGDDHTDFYEIELERLK